MISKILWCTKILSLAEMGRVRIENAIAVNIFQENVDNSDRAERVGRIKGEQISMHTPRHPTSPTHRCTDLVVLA